MAHEEPQVATKAPESDAQEDIQEGTQKPIFQTTDTKVEQGASLGEHCVTDRPTPSGANPTGEVTKYNEIEVYVTKPADYPHSPSKLLLLLSNATGVHSTNNQLQADKFAAEGFLVVMPDQFGGDPLPSTYTVQEEEENTTIIEKIKMAVASIPKSFTIDTWLARQTPEKVLPILNKVVTSVKEEYADAIANGGGIYAVGYCFGARYVVLLGNELDKEAVAGQRSKDTEAEEGMVKQGPQIKCGAIAHGTQIGKEELANIQVPISIVAVENDSLFPDEVREAAVKSLQERQLEHEQKVFPGVPHGFATAGEYEDAKIQEAQREAFDIMLGWLKSH
ncbi:alpha/beta-hydrolase [Polychaeton citri CBS 116435]|uniref:Alpha/beta-hydrolase n=1 Tax=Polychaeton citri CBS 116435 TaxID=1314669 RepID=A0A9P4URQ2_9PEZI|nr:alpha/beta-hydrolase [Polychaeton citri CBS 116435]